jgi:Ca-activated chloride channel family protein
MHAIGTLFTVLRKVSRCMTYPSLSRILLLIALVLPFGTTHAQEATNQPPLTRMLFVFDASNSMNAFWGSKTRLEVARELMLKSLDELEGLPDLELALRVYGNRSPIQAGKQDCDDTTLEVPFSANSAPAMRNFIKNLRAVGTTPIARSLERSADDFPAPTTPAGATPKRGERAIRNVIILITDGIEACDEDPCAVSRALQSKGITLKPFVIGVGLDESEKYTLRCIGNFFDADTPELFEHVLQIVLTQALNTTTAQISLLTTDGKPTETDVPVTLYDQRTGQVRYHFVHTMNDRGVPDTLMLDPVFTYRVVAHTLPPSVRENVKIKPGQHTIVTVDAGMGRLKFKVGSGPGDGQPIQAVVRRKGEPTTLHVQDMSAEQRYRVGTYDLEVLTLPRLMISDVRIEQGRTTEVAIPRSGVLNVQANTPGHGAIFLKKDDALEWVADLDATAPRNQLRLLPGKYLVTYRSRNAKRTELSLDKDVTIESGRAVTVNF